MRRSLVIVVLLAMGLPATAQDRLFSSEGKFQESRSTSLLEPAARGLGAPGRPFDVLSYRILLELAMTDEMLTGRIAIRLVLIEPADSIRLHAAALSLDSVLVDSSPCGTLEYPEAEEVALALGGTRNAGDTLTVEISYRRLPGMSRPSSRQGYYFFDTAIGIPANLGYTMSEPSDARFWMPCVDDPSEKATAEISVTVPEGYMAVSNGTLLGTESRGDGTVTWHWREANQIATYLMSVTASEFTLSSVPFVRGAGDTIPLQYVVWEQDSADCSDYLPTVHQMVTALSELFGPYPFDKYGMTAVTPFQFGGMEHQTITTLHRAYKTTEGVVVHELAHQWWGDLVTCGTWKDIWLNESFATYSEALWAEWLGGPEALKDEMAGKLTFQYGSWTGAIYDPVGQGFNLFANSVYSKGAWVLHTLRGVLGDSLFFRTLAAYRESHRQSSAITDDLRAVVDSLSGESYQWFFDQWVYGKGWPEYAYRYRAESDTLEVTVYQMQSTAWPTYTMPIPLRLHGAGHDTTIVLRNTLRAETFRLASPFSVQSVDLDPDGWILKRMVDAPVSVDAPGAPPSFRLLQNYPNPFNPSTIIRYELPSSQRVNLAVYDLLGREVARLVDQEQARGSYAVAFGGEGLAAGLYLYRIQTTPLEEDQEPGYSAARKMVFVK